MVLTTRSLRELTDQFERVMNERDPAKLLDLMAEDCEIRDPFAHLKGKAEIIRHQGKFLENVSHLVYTIINYYEDVEASTSIAEFEMSLDAKTLKGIDVIRWDKNDKIRTLSCYFFKQ